MLCPAATFTAAGRLNATLTLAPAAPTTVLGGAGFTAGNVILDSTAVPAGAPVLAGIARRADGAIYGTTSTAGTDTFPNGVRVSASGQLVVVQADPANIQNGNPYNASGVLCIA